MKPYHPPYDSDGDLLAAGYGGAPAAELSLLTEYRVTWRWRELWGHGLYPLRHKTFKTRAGADRLIAKLESNGGRYENWYDPNDEGRDGVPSSVTLAIDVLTLEVRTVGRWFTAESHGDTADVELASESSA